MLHSQRPSSPLVIVREAAGNEHLDDRGDAGGSHEDEVCQAVAVYAKQDLLMRESNQEKKRKRQSQDFKIAVWFSAYGGLSDEPNLCVLRHMLGLHHVQHPHHPTLAVLPGHQLPQRHNELIVVFINQLSPGPLP